jgi:undecaprenyl-diphosphatase
MPHRVLLSQIIARIRASPGLAVLIVMMAAAAYAFIAVVDEVMEGDSHKLDEWIIKSLRTPGDAADPIGPLWVQTMFMDITSLGGTTVVTLITLVVLGYLVMERKRAAALLVLIAVAGGAGLSSLLKLGFERPRPDLVAHLVDVHTLSFPSGHAMVSAVIYLTLGALLAQVQRSIRLKAYILSIAVILTLLIGISRVYLGVHWPTDVAAGWCAGFAWAIGCWVIAAWLQAEGKIEGEGS